MALQFSYPVHLRVSPKTDLVFLETVTAHQLLLLPAPDELAHLTISVD